MTIIDALFLGLMLFGSYFIVGAAVFITSVDGHPKVSTERAFCRAVLWPVHMTIGWPE